MLLAKVRIPPPRPTLPSDGRGTPILFASRFMSSETTQNEESAILEQRKRNPSAYWLSRFVLLRFLGVVYLTAFLVAANQAVPLIGHEGLLPADAFLEKVALYFGSRDAGFRQIPSIFWWNVSDACLANTAWVGVALSAVVVCGYANSIIMLVLWALYMSFVHVGQLWYSYGWETQLLETGFIAVFLCPLLDPRPFPRMPPPLTTLWLYRWLIFRIMLGAGLIKIRGDECWRDFTALLYHYETQPVPNPVSRFLHFAPAWFHRFGVMWNHFVELVVPWFAFGPKLARNAAGLLMAGFMGVLIFSGNLSFLNWLTIVPCLACLDDSFWQRILPSTLVRRAQNAQLSARHSRLPMFASGIFALVVAWLSIKPVQNLISPQQAMNASFDMLHLVNTYGAFGSVGRERYEIVFEGTEDRVPSEAAVWRAYEFKVKPGATGRRPSFISPYHYRLDWQIWFAAIPGVHYDMRTMPTPQHYPWVVHFVWKLLHNHPGTLSLLANNPFPDAPPRYVRAVLYRYQFAPIGAKDGAWWTREQTGMWLQAVSLYTPEFRRFLESTGMITKDAE
jgi:hypothetical protein